MVILLLKKGKEGEILGTVKFYQHLPPVSDLAVHQAPGPCDALALECICWLHTQSPNRNFLPLIVCICRHDTEKGPVVLSRLMVRCPWFLVSFLSHRLVLVHYGRHL